MRNEPAASICHDLPSQSLDTCSYIGALDRVAVGIIFPRLGVRQQSGRLYFRGLERFRVYETPRQPGEEAREVAPPSLSVTFHCQNLLPDGDVIGDDWLAYERKGQELVASGKVPSATLSGAAQWSDYVNSDPLAVVQETKTEIHKAVGEIPNTLVLPEPVVFTLESHPRILNAFGTTVIPARGRLKNLFDVENLVVADSRVWNNNVLLCYVPREPGRGKMALGYTFSWQGLYDLKFVEPKAAFYWINSIG